MAARLLAAVADFLRQIPRLLVVMVALPIIAAVSVRLA